MKTTSLRSLALLSALALVAASPESAATWNGVTLGTPASQLRATLGDPLRILESKDGSSHVARYWLAGSDSTFFLIVERRGYVEAFHAFTQATPDAPIAAVPPDPSGVRLGDTLESVKAKHPGFRSDTGDDGAPRLVGRGPGTSTAIMYEFAGGRVRVFEWSSPVPDSAPVLPGLTEPAGDSLPTALLDAQKDETSGVHFEYMYVGYHPCDDKTPWHFEHQALLNENGRAYDRLHVLCPTTKAERDFYFDITPYFGKM